MDILKNVAQQSLKTTNRVSLYFSLTIFFFAVSNGITSYFFPILALQTGLSNTAMGFLYSASSLFGIVFDLLLSKYLVTTSYKKLYIYAIILLIILPLALVSSPHFAIYIFGVAIWGLYSNLSSFGYYDFTATEKKKEDHSKTFASLSIMNSLGYVVAPLIAGYTIMKIGRFDSVLMPVFAGFVALLFILLTITTSNKHKTAIAKSNTHPTRSFQKEIAVLLQVALRIWPILFLRVNLTFMEATFWTVAPVIENISTELKGMGGIMLALTMLPTLVISWSISPLTAAYGKKKTAFFTFLFSNLLLLVVGFVSNPYIILLLIFLVNVLQSITYPAAAAAVADFLKESTSYDNELVATHDMATNAGYIIGPIFAGVAMDFVGDLRIFSVIAVLGILSSIILIAFSPRKIPFTDRDLK